MSGVYVIADLHLGHVGITNRLKTYEGKPARDFESVEAMNEYIVEQWNAIISKRDVVYILGDAVMGKKNLHYLDRLAGIKYLVMGNHDGLGAAVYLQHFRKLYGVAEVHDCILSHVPLHVSSVLPRYPGGNIHGHLHSLQVPDSVDHLCVSAEQVGYEPKTLEWAKAKIEKKRKGYHA